jgi:hypothetical protein
MARAGYNQKATPLSPEALACPGGRSETDLLGRALDVGPPANSPTKAAQVHIHESFQARAMEQEPDIGRRARRIVVLPGVDEERPHRSEATSSFR